MQLKCYGGGSILRLNAISQNMCIDSYCPGCFKLKSSKVIHSCGTCFACCRCVLCLSCQMIGPFSHCNACKQCYSCCACTKCRTCGLIFSDPGDLCTQCGGGKGCCCPHNKALSASTLRTKRPVNLVHYAPRQPGDCQLNPSKRLIAAEIEICGFSQTTQLTALRETLESWNCSVVSDGSLPETGIEINTHPAGGDFWVDQITDIGHALELTKAWVNQRAGCHIHIDCRECGYLDLAKLLRILGCIEAALYTLIPPSRTNNQYCVYWASNYLQCLRLLESTMLPSWNERQVTLAYRKVILNALYGYHHPHKINEVKLHKGASNRYRGTNIHSFVHRGTVEFRMPHGTVYSHNIINWGMMLASLVDYAKANTMVDIIVKCSEVENQLAEKVLFSKSFVSIPQDVRVSSTALLIELLNNKMLADWIISQQKDMKKAGPDYTERL